MGHQTEKISVIIPVRNRFDLLKSALTSVALQEHVDEVLIVDDSTEQGLQNLVQDFPQLNIKVYANVNKGIGGARSMGLALARNPFVAFLDSDDVWKEGFLSSAMETLRKFPNSAGVFVLSDVFFDLGFSLKSRVKILFLNFIKKNILFFLYFFNRGTLPTDAPFLVQISHAVFRNKNLPKFREDLKASEDWIFFFDIQKKLGPLRIIPRKLVGMRYSPKSNSFGLTQGQKNFKAISNAELLRILDESGRPSLLVSLFRFYNRHFLIKDA